MTKTKSLIQKILSGLLSFAMVITGALSLGTMKKHTASAEAIMGLPRTQTNVEAFAYDMVMHMEIFPDKESCFIVDSQFLFGATLQGLIELEDEPFFVGFARGLRDRLVFDNIDISPEDCSLMDLLDLAQMSICLHHHGTRNYVNLTTGDFEDTVRTKYALMELMDLFINDNPYYAAIVSPWDNTYYNMLYSLQAKEFPVYLFSTDDLNLSGTGLIMRAKTTSGDFTLGCAWSEE